MDKLEMHSPDLTASNIHKIAELFPAVISESMNQAGETVRAVDFDLLRQELSDHVVEGPQERYQLDWPGKRQAMFVANAPIAKTLRPQRDESVDFPSTQNLFIEGDNLDVLKLLQEAYLGKIRVIYIDPPYNTGGDRFIYPDDYSADSASYLRLSSQIDLEGQRLVSNLESNGRFHSDWLSMMFPRLKLARNLLSDDGAIFVSIDDNEVANLRLMLDAVFGRANFVENYIWESNFRPDNSSRIERENAQHILCYARRKANLGPLVGAQKATEGLPSLTKSSMKESTLNIDPAWLEVDLEDGTYLAGDRGSGYRLEGDVVVSGGVVQGPVVLTGRMIWSQSYLEQQAQAGTRIVIKTDSFVPYSRKAATAALAPTTLIPRDIAKDVLAGNAEVRALFGSVVFDHPKPTSLIKYLINSVVPPDEEAIVLDFFAGSSSTADAVLQLNGEDAGRRRFIMVQLEEDTALDSEAAALGFATISSLSRERIRRAAARQLNGGDGRSQTNDLGFRAFVVDTTCMVDVLRLPDAVEQHELELYQGSVRADRSSEDLLFETLIDLGVELTGAVEVEVVDGKEVLTVEGGALVACFDEGLSGAVVRWIAERQPLRAVFRDSSFATDSDRINVEQVFAEVSPGTEVKAI